MAHETTRPNSKRVRLALAAIGALCLACAIAALIWVRHRKTASTGVVSSAGPTFTVSQSDLHEPVSVIAYGDMRFTDPGNTTASNPIARQALVKRIAEEKPDALLLNGDVPWHGGTQDDYAVYRSETRPWRDAQLRVFPALGNHEFSRCEVPQCLANWWTTFPELKARRWYSVLLGKYIYVIALDSNDSLLPGSGQRLWLENQVDSLPDGIHFVLITMHHPPVADIQTRFEVSHNPRPNEIALRQYLSATEASSTARFVVIAGHIHNYERFLRDGVTYLVSGGGGAKPYPVDRSTSDLYQNPAFPNYHYVKFVLNGGDFSGTMFRLTLGDSPRWQAMDTFEITSK
jgi:acid phosphatase type 7